MKKKVFKAFTELKKLNKIISQLNPDMVKMTEGLVADASFMAEQLEKLRIHIEENGWSEEYQNGANQRGKKSSVEAEAYIKLQKSYASIIRQLTDLIHKQEVNGAGLDLMEFINKD